MTRPTAKIIQFAEALGVTIEEVSNYRFSKEIKHMKSDAGKEQSGICQSDDMVAYMTKFGYDYHLNVRVWLATFQGKIVGILMMSKVFNPSARAHSVSTNNFIPQHNNFVTHSKEISDMLAVCAKGFPGLGKLLTLIALSESGPKGLFLQVQQIYIEKAEPDPNDPSHLIFVRKSSVSDAAKVIYTRYGFQEIGVSDGSNMLNILCYYRDSPLKDEEGVRLLNDWERSWTSRRNLAPLEEKKQREEKIQEIAVDFEIIPSPQLDFGEGDYSFVDVPHDYTQNELYAQDLNNGPDVILDQEFGDAAILAQGEEGQNFDFDPLYGLEPQERQVPQEEKKIQSPPRKRARANQKQSSYKCDQCDKTFTRSDNYKRHLKTHGGSKDYECPRCHEKFLRQEDMKDHVKRKHQKIRDRPCPYCDYKAGNTSDLYKHMDKKHPGQPRK